MSMTAYFVHLGRNKLEEVISLFAESDDYLAIDELLPSLEYNSQYGTYLDLDQSWHGLHFLLCDSSSGGEPPFANAILGGEPFGEDMGYGPPRFLTPDEVQAIALALNSIQEQQLQNKYDSNAFKDARIYPMSWGDNPQEDIECLMTYFRSLKDFYSKASSQQNAVILWIG